MFKKIFAIATVMCVFPMMASAASWKLTTRAMSQGGGIDSQNKTGQTVLDGTLAKSFTNFSSVTVKPAAGFKISKLSQNGLISVPAPGNFTVTPTGTFSLQATFARVPFAITATAGTGGSVNKTSYPVVYSGTQSPVKSFVFTPNPGQFVSSVVVTGAGAVAQNLNAVTGALVTLPAAVGVKIKTNIATVGTESITVTGAFGGTAAATAPVSGASCESCHKSQGVGPGVFASWSSSTHKTGNVQCYKCHVGSNTGAHPGVTPTDATCASCHSSIAGHSAATNTCSKCHDKHAASTTHSFAYSQADCANCHLTVATPHYGGTAFHKAQYVSDTSLPVSCADCHGDSATTTANQAILGQYTSSGHGSPIAEAWVHFDWRSASRSTCQRCHAGTAFVAKLGNENSTTNAYQASDVLKPGEVLNCSACHTDAGTGAIRSAAQQFTINMTNGASVTYQVAGASALCARCHSGRATGASITADPDTTGIRGFIDSHYQPAAGTLYNLAGYEYAGQSYDSLGGHKLLGATSQGPCVTCHMSGKNHTLDAASCGTCHNGVTAPVVNAATLKANYDAALNDLKLALEAKGIHYGSAHPFFYTAPYVAGSTNTAFTNWGSVYGASAWKDTMGAAFNYNLLRSEKGAYAHNYNYAMKLIADSIDFISDGAVGL